MSKYTLRVARTSLETILIIDCDEDANAEANQFAVCGDLLEDTHISDYDYNFKMWEKEIPKERGIYEVVIEYESYQSNHYLDPVEYNTDISIESVKKLV